MKKEATPRFLKFFVACGFAILSIVGAKELSAQNIGINGTGNNPDPSAMLHVEAADKGLLIPRVGLNDTATQAPIAVAPAEGLMIYNETGTAPKGYYYWDAGKGQWLQVGTGAEDDDWDRDDANGYMFPANMGDQIGIGTNTPTTVPNTQVELNNGGFASMSFVSNSVEGIFTSSSSNSRVSIGSYSNHDVYFWTGAGEKMRMVDGGNLMVNPAQNTTNFQVLGDGEPNLLFGDAANNRVGVGQNAPAADLHIADADGGGTSELRFDFSNNTRIESNDSWGDMDYYSDDGLWGHRFFVDGNFTFGVEDDRIEVNEMIEDGTGNTGNNGQVLTPSGAGTIEWQDVNDLGGSDNDWYYESTDSSMLKDVGVAADCVLVGTNGAGPWYSYDFAVDNGSGDGTRVGMGSVEYFEDGLNLFQFYGGDFYVDDNLEVNGGGFSTWALRVGNNTADNAYFDVGGNSWDDVVMDRSSGEGTFRPSSDFYGYLGTNSEAWWYQYRYNEVNTSLRSKKKDITELEGVHYERVMQDIRDMDMAFYRYKGETKEFQKGKKATKYRPTPHIGTFVGEVPDYLKDNTFSGILTDGYASLAMAGVKQLDQRMKELEEQHRTITIEDFGSSELRSETVQVRFNSNFRNKLEKNDKLPVISLTSIGKDGELYVKEKDRKGFVVASSRGDRSVKRFDWSARARINSEVEKGKEESLGVDLEVSESEKEQLEQYLKEQRRKKEAERKERIRQRIEEARRKGGEDAVKELKRRLEKEGVELEGDK